MPEHLTPQQRLKTQLKTEFLTCTLNKLGCTLTALLLAFGAYAWGSLDNWNLMGAAAALSFAVLCLCIQVPVDDGEPSAKAAHGIDFPQSH